MVRFILFCTACAAALAASTAQTRTAGQPAGAWTGTVGPATPCSSCIPRVRRYRPAATLLVTSGGAVTATFDGLTGASHDAPTLTTTCSIHYRFLRQKGASFEYLQQGPNQYHGRGYVANAPCILADHNALRLTRISASQLRADYGSFYRDHSLPGTPLVLDYKEAAFRSYLRRSR